MSSFVDRRRADGEQVERDEAEQLRVELDSVYDMLDRQADEWEKIADGQKRLMDGGSRVAAVAAGAEYMARDAARTLRWIKRMGQAE